MSSSSDNSPDRFTHDGRTFTKLFDVPTHDPRVLARVLLRARENAQRPYDTETTARLLFEAAIRAKTLH